MYVTLIVLYLTPALSAGGCRGLRPWIGIPDQAARPNVAFPDAVPIASGPSSPRRVKDWLRLKIAKSSVYLAPV